MRLASISLAVTAALFASQSVAQTAPPMLTPADGQTTFFTYEGFLSPMQEPGEETDAPPFGPSSTKEPIKRADRTSRGFGQIRLTRDLSKGVIDLHFEGVNLDEVTMLHLHCGPPGVLGPIVLDLGALGDIKKELADGKWTVEFTNENLTFITHMPKGLKPRLPEGCPVDKTFFLTQATTLAALDHLARKGVLYWNLHSTRHAFFGEMRGQIYPSDR